MKGLQLQIAKFLYSSFGIAYKTQERIFTLLVIVGLLWLTAWLIIRLVAYRIENPQTRYRVRKLTRYVIGFVTFVILMRELLTGIKLATFLGLATAGVVLASRDIWLSFAGWLYIIVRSPFEVGDRIQIGRHQGDVIDVEMLAFTISEVDPNDDSDQNTGRIIEIPNHKVFSEAIANHYRGFEHLWTEVKVLLTFESDWQAAKRIIEPIANEHAEDLTRQAEAQIWRASRRYMMHSVPLTPVIYTAVTPQGILLTIRLLCERRRSRETSSAIWEGILVAFQNAPNIALAFPDQILYTRTHPDEKAQTKPAAPPLQDS